MKRRSSGIDNGIGIGAHSSNDSNSTDLQSLLARLKAHAPVAERHVWLLNLLDWVRGPGQSVAASVGRVELFLDTLQARPDLQALTSE